MNAAELDAIRARVAADEKLINRVPGTVHADRAALLADLEVQWRAGNRWNEQVHNVRIVLGQVEDALKVSVGRESCGICAGDCCRSSDQPVADGLVRLRLIVGPR